MAHHKVLSWDVANFFTEMWFVSRRGRITCLYGCFPYVFFILHEKFTLTNKVTEGLPTAQVHQQCSGCMATSWKGVRGWQGLHEGTVAGMLVLGVGKGSLPAEWVAGATHLACAPGESTALRGWSPGTSVGTLPWKCVKDRGAHIPLHTYTISELCSTAAANFRGHLWQEVAPCLKTNEKLEKYQ